jgi:ribosomal protein S18 acetylase RimI-like enzyme
MNAPTVRAATRTDLAFLEAILVEAANWDGARPTTLASVRADPKAWRYLQGWQRPTDFGVVALDGGALIGAVWARFLSGADAGYGYVGDAIPELTIGVTSNARGLGVGRLLLDSILDSARQRGLEAVSLSVEDGNTRARLLYERVGFVPVGRNGGSDTMLIEFAAP